METTTIKISGMTCGGCVKSVTRVLTALPGVEKADVSLTPGTAAVAFDAQKINVEQIKSAIREAGFEAA